MESDDEDFKSDCEDTETFPAVYSQQDFTCPNCRNVGPLELIDESHEQVCSKCGIVFESALAGEDIWTSGKHYNDEDNSTTGVTLYNMNGRDFILKGYDSRKYFLATRNECIREIKCFSCHFGLTTVQAERVKNFFLNIVDLNLAPLAGRKAKLYMAACTYVVVRQEGLGIGLLEIAARIDITIWKLGKAYKKVKDCLGLHIDDIDPLLFLERTIKNSFGRLVFGQNECQKYIHDSIIIKNLPITPHKLSKTASKLINIATDASLCAGRKPEAMAAAAVVLAMEAHTAESDLPVPPCWNKAPTTKMLVEVLAEVMHIPESTIRQRHREISQVICSHAESLPWVQKPVSLKKVNMYLLDVLSFWEQLKKADPTLKVPEKREEEGKEVKEGEEKKGEEKNGEFQSGNSLDDCIGIEEDTNMSQQSLEVEQQTMPINRTQPPSFRRACIFTRNREAKLSLAKERVKLNLLPSLEKCTLNPSNIPPNVDEEVLLLEKLLMFNFQDFELLHPSISKLREMVERQARIILVEGGTIAASEHNWNPRGIVVSSRRSDELDDKEVDHRDMSENEYNIYVRPMAEVVSYKKAKEDLLRTFVDKDLRKVNERTKKKTRKPCLKERAKVSGSHAVESNMSKSSKSGEAKSGNRKPKEHRSKRVKISKHVEDMIDEEFS